MTLRKYPHFKKPMVGWIRVLVQWNGVVGKKIIVSWCPAHSLMKLGSTENSNISSGFVVDISMVFYSYPSWIHMKVSINPGTQKWMVYSGKSQSKMDNDLRYPHFKKPPYGSAMCNGLVLLGKS